MSSVRELLETAVPREPRAAVPAAELRGIAGRRTRRGQAAGVAVALAAVAVATVVGVRAFKPAPERNQVAVTPTVLPSVTPVITPPPSGAEFAALVGTRWIPDLVNTGVATTQAYPDDAGTAPRALITFEAGHVLVVDYVANGHTTTVRGTWLATSSTPAVDDRAAGALRISLSAPAGAPDDLTRLVNRLSLVAFYAMYASEGPPPSLTPFTMTGYSVANVSMVAIDLVKPGVVLPSPYPSRP